MTNKAQKAHYSAMARLGCILCRELRYGETPAELHHIRRTSKRSNAPVIPLCREHHRGDSGIHGLGRKGFEKRYGITEECLLERSLTLIGENNASTIQDEIRITDRQVLSEATPY
jgi:hypothetical protein